MIPGYLDEAVEAGAIPPIDTAADRRRLVRGAQRGRRPLAAGGRPGAARGRLPDASRALLFRSVRRGRGAASPTHSALSGRDRRRPAFDDSGVGFADRLRVAPAAGVGTQTGQSTRSSRPRVPIDRRSTRSRSSRPRGRSDSRPRCGSSPRPSGRSSGSGGRGRSRPPAPDRFAARPQPGAAVLADAVGSSPPADTPRARPDAPRRARVHRGSPPTADVRGGRSGRLARAADASPSLGAAPSTTLTVGLATGSPGRSRPAGGRARVGRAGARRARARGFDGGSPRPRGRARSGSGTLRIVDERPDRAGLASGPSACSPGPSVAAGSTRSSWPAGSSSALRRPRRPDGPPPPRPNRTGEHDVRVRPGRNDVPGRDARAPRPHGRALVPDRRDRGHRRARRGSGRGRTARGRACSRARRTARSTPSSWTRSATSSRRSPRRCSRGDARHPAAPPRPAPRDPDHRHDPRRGRAARARRAAPPDAGGRRRAARRRAGAHRRARGLRPRLVRGPDRLAGRGRRRRAVVALRCGLVDRTRRRRCSPAAGSSPTPTRTGSGRSRGSSCGR